MSQALGRDAGKGKGLRVGNLAAGAKRGVVV